MLSSMIEPRFTVHLHLCDSMINMGHYIADGSSQLNSNAKGIHIDHIVAEATSGRGRVARLSSVSISVRSR